MSMRRQEKDEKEFASECSYCGAGVKDNAMRCPKCKRMFSSGKKAIVFSVVAIVVLASMGAFFYTYLDPGHEGYDGGNDIPDGGNNNNNGGGNTGKYMVIGTNLGQIKIELDTVKAPVTSTHMIDLVNSGYFSGTGMFYRSEPGFVIQGGTKSGSSDTVAWEDTNMVNAKYTISMARSGNPDDAASSGTGSSEFFINLNANTNLDSYQYPYVVFGRVVSGFSIVDQIGTMATQDEGGIKILDNPVQFTSCTISNS